MARPAVLLALVAFIAALLLAPAVAQNQNPQLRERARRHVTQSRARELST
jgi:hypothetical protein